MQRAVLDAVLLRVMALWESLSIVGYTAGAFLAPVLVALLGPRWAFVPLGVGMALASLLVLRRLRPLDDRAVFRTDVLARLRGVSFLSGLPPAGLDRVARSAEWVDVSGGDDVVVQGEPGDAYFVVDAGLCAVGVDGSRRHGLGPGDGFGEVALLLEVPRTATVTATEKCRLLRVDRADFLAALGRSPEGAALGGDGGARAARPHRAGSGPRLGRPRPGARAGRRQHPHDQTDEHEVADHLHHGRQLGHVKLARCRRSRRSRTP